MAATVSDIIQVLEGIAPLKLAEDWDNVGLQIGHTDQLVHHIWISLDPSLEVVTEACENKVDLLITHHPLFFSPVKTLDLKTPVGAIVEKAIRCNLSIYSSHTNLDSVEGGLNDMLADIIGLSHRSVLLPSEAIDTVPAEIKHGLGRIGDLALKTDLASFAQHLRSVLNLNSIRIVGAPDFPVSRVAICTGSGSSLMKTVVKSGADVFVTGDIKYHDAKTAQEDDIRLIDIGHFNSEHIMVKALTDKMIEIIKELRWPIKIAPCIIEKDPFMVL